MYEELMPYWKERCRRLDDTNKVLLEMTRESSPWTYALAERGIYYNGYIGVVIASKIGEFEWVKGETGWDCIVLGVMLFTYEQGIAP